MIQHPRQCVHGGERLRTDKIEPKGCCDNGEIAVFACAVQGEATAESCRDCKSGIETPPQPQSPSVPLFDPLPAIIAEVALAKPVRDLRSKAFLAVNGHLPPGGRKVLKPRPWQFPTGKPKIGLLISALQLGGVGSVLVDLAKNVSRVEFAHVAMKQLERVFPPFVQGFNDAGCCFYSGNHNVWIHNAQTVIDNSNAILMWGFLGPGAWKGLNFRGLPVITFAQNTKEDSWCCAEIAGPLNGGISSRFLACSEAAIETYPERVRSQVKVIYNGVDASKLLPTRSREDRRHTWGLAQDSIVLGYLGRLSQHKHPDDVAKAAKELGEGYTGLIVGDGQWESECRVRCHDLPVIFEPAIEHIANGLGAIDVFVNTSEYEGSSLALVEAWLFGVPVVSTPTGSIPELERKAGRKLCQTVPIGATPQEIAGAVTKALQDRETVEFARQFSLSHLTAKEMARQFEDFVLEFCPETSEVVIGNRPEDLNYCIAFSKRSGSSYLCDLLRNTKEMGWPEEVFDYRLSPEGHKVPRPEPYCRGPGHWDYDSWQTYYDSYVINSRTRNGICGFKSTFYQWENLVLQLGSEPRVDVWIWLRRRDRIRQAISLYRAEKTGQFCLWGQDKSVPSPKFDREEILALSESLRSEDENWANYFARRGITATEIWYEDFIKNPTKTIQLIAYKCEHRIDTLQGLRSTMRAQTDSITEEWVRLLR